LRIATALSSQYRLDRSSPTSKRLVRDFQLDEPPRAPQTETMERHILMKRCRQSRDSNSPRSQHRRVIPTPLHLRVLSDLVFRRDLGDDNIRIREDRSP